MTDGLRIIGHDAADQPVSISQGGYSSTFAYDGNLKRVKQTTQGGAVTYTVYSKASALVYRDEVNAARHTTYLGAGPAGVRLVNGAATYTHSDTQGSVVAATDAAGAVLWRERYTPFGDTLVNDPGNRDNTGYTGYLRDTDFGLDYAQARYYDPVTGRFLEPDPLREADQINLYAYVGNDPMDKTDPTGNDAVMVTNPDGSRTLVIPVNYTGDGAKPGEIAKIGNSIKVVGSKDTIKIVPTSTPVQGTLNHMDVSPGYDYKNYPSAGEGQKAGPGVEGTGGNEAHINSSNSQANEAGAHDTLHFAGITDKYVEGPRDANGNRTSEPSPGFTNSNIMSSRSGTEITQAQFNEASKNPTTKSCVVTEKQSCQ